MRVKFQGDPDFYDRANKDEKTKDIGFGVSEYVIFNSEKDAWEVSEMLPSKLNMTRYLSKNLDLVDSYNKALEDLDLINTDEREEEGTWGLEKFDSQQAKNRTYRMLYQPSMSALQIAISQAPRKNAKQKDLFENYLSIKLKNYVKEVLQNNIEPNKYSGNGWFGRLHSELCIFQVNNEYNSLAGEWVETDDNGEKKYQTNANETVSNGTAPNSKPKLNFDSLIKGECRLSPSTLKVDENVSPWLVARQVTEGELIAEQLILQTLDNNGKTTNLECHKKGLLGPTRIKYRDRCQDPSVNDDLGCAINKVNKVEKDNLRCDEYLGYHLEWEGDPESDSEMEGVCYRNQCTCQNGTAAVTVAENNSTEEYCKQHGEEQCSECKSAGYKLTETKICEPIQCVCHQLNNTEKSFGYPAMGDNCTKEGELHCDGCHSPGYMLKTITEEERLNFNLTNQTSTNQHCVRNHDESYNKWDFWKDKDQNPELIPPGINKTERNKNEFIPKKHDFCKGRSCEGEWVAFRCHRTVKIADKK